MHKARGYQVDVKNGCYDAWREGAQVIQPVVPTGGGKTKIVGDVVREMHRHSGVIAHRQELVGQISVALAREGIQHDIWAPKKTRDAIVAAHMEEVGRKFYNPHSPVKAIGIDTMLNRFDDPAMRAWAAQLGLGVIDEGHHVLKGNKWGDAIDWVEECKKAAYGEAFQQYQALWMLPTATPGRADGRGSGRHADGYVDRFVLGPTARWLIDEGYLTDYRILCPGIPSDLDLSGVSISDATGDLSKNQLRQAVHKSKKLVGNIVKHYLKHAPGKLGVTFAVDVEAATEIAQAFRDAGVSAEVITAKTPDDVRRRLLRAFKNREITMLVNVDLFGEGFDLPAIEVVIMARPTASFGLYAQQFGRALRLMISKILMGAWDTYTGAQRRQFIAESEKPVAIIIDHVGNVERHGLPDKPREHSLDRRERRTRSAVSDAIPLRVCLNEACIQPYERVFKACPYCGTEALVVTRDIKSVDGDLFELPPEVLAIMRGEVARIDAPPPTPRGLSDDALRGLSNSHRARQRAQAQLRHALNSWAAVHASDTESMRYRRFYLTFGVDVVSAMAYNTRDAETLLERINAKLLRDGYFIPQPTHEIPESFA